ncbi:MAG: Flp family type IVb pilin [Firmicutes bacterium]|nr:Flp family type IVb pilin [Bacillota bacterium]
MFKKICGILKDENGQGMAEYGLILALIAIAVIVTVTALGSSLRAKFTTVKDALEQAQPQ